MKRVSALKYLVYIIGVFLCGSFVYAKPPNIILIIGDDVGFSDLSPFGGDIDTPNLNTLAAEGISFTNYHTPPACSPSRAQLHTGVDHHLTGFGRWDYAPYSGRDGLPGYEGYLTPDQVSIAELLRDAGYQTFISGKWHQGHKPHTDPIHHGFDQSYVLLEGGANNYTNWGMTAGWPVANFTRNGQKVKREEGDHSDKYWAEQLIKMLEQRNGDQPFYGVLSFQTAHFPIQAPDNLIDKYQARLASGWEQQRQTRLSRQIDVGILNRDNQPQGQSDPPQKPWGDLAKAERRYEIKRGAIYAAMIEHHDIYIGKLVEYLRSMGEYENTLIIYVSDNGAAQEDFRGGLPGPKGQKWFEQNFDHSYQSIGSAKSNLGPGPYWGISSNTPRANYKLTVQEGGINVPLIVRYPATSHPGRYSHALSQPMDVAATILAAASVTHPGSNYKGRDVFPLQGRSLLSLINNQTDRIYAKDEAVVIELLGNGAILMDKWKLMRMRAGSGGSNEWELFDLVNDPQESTDLKLEFPEVYEGMLAKYQAYAQQYNIVPVADDWIHRPGSE